MVKCPKCGKENRTPVNEWYRGPKSDPKQMRIRRFVCSSCGTSYISWLGKSGELKVMTRKG